MKDPVTYTAEVLELFERRPYAGRMTAAPDVYSGRAGDVAKGIDMQFWIKFALGRIQATSFLAFGCPHVIAAGSWWAQRIRGLSIEDAKRVTWQEVEQALAIPAEKRGKLLVIEDAITAALGAISI
jgi:NifU-like protein involved in Fe-S cluster formation